MKAPEISIVIPCYNEEAIIVSSVHTLSKILSDLINKHKIAYSSFILAVDDGSNDRTIELLKICAEHFPVRIIQLTKNFGHQYALLAGLHYSLNKVDCCITLDADLQDDPNVISKMLDIFKSGFDVVYGVRSDRSTDSFFKKTTAWLFYKLMLGMGVPLVYNHADYRLLSNKVLKALKKYKESNLFLRGIIPLLGFRSSTVHYKRNKRLAGKSKYPFWKMLQFAIRGITSFSSHPLKLITIAGISVSVICAGFSIWALIVIIKERNIPGWASITLPLYFLGGIQLLAIGVLGEYISKIFQETKRRPPYHIEKIIEPEDWKESPFAGTHKDPLLEKLY